jgi:hypothetical protein
MSWPDDASRPESRGSAAGAGDAAAASRVDQVDMSRLERRHRAVLWLLPASYRAVLDWPGLVSVALVAAVLFPGAAARPAHWSYALTLVAPLVLAQRLLSIDTAGPYGPRAGWLALALAEAAAVLGCGLLAAAGTSQALRAVPDADPGAAWPASGG